MSLEKISQPQVSTEETDQLSRSNKKYKRKITNWIFDTNNDHDVQMADPAITGNNIPGATSGFPAAPTPQPSFRDMLNVRNHSSMPNPQIVDTVADDDVSDDDCAPEEFINNDKCPSILLTKEEKIAMRRPWK